jgi:hypothetical protein
MSVNFSYKYLYHTSRDLNILQNITTWDPWLYFPLEGSRAMDFIALKNPSLSALFEPRTLGPVAIHYTAEGSYEIRIFIIYTLHQLLLGSWNEE